ncbi:MAG: EAL domain-containing protein [Silanimonas sp.]|jgi:predicted signal transduction protein with EAL and GGDEF domain|nr:EAL domain-containing protein [Silanimonas sp.]
MEGNGHATTVLVAEDDASIRIVLLATLRSAGYRVLVAENGVEALAIARADRPTLVISDVLMPGGDGQALLAALRADPRTTDLPFVFLTGLDERESVRKGMDLGADDYLTKPFRPTELLSLVQAQLLRFARRDEQRRRLEAEARRLRQFDSVTGLPNRAYFVERVAEDAALGGALAVASLALGQWPQLRQSIGQAPADEVLREGANRLLEGVRARLGFRAMLARSGEHRFALSIPVDGDEAGLDTLLHELLAPLARPVDAGGRRLFFDASVGVALFPRDGGSVERLLDQAERAEPDTAPGGTLAFYSAESNALRGRRVQLHQDLREALDRGELTLAYQPQLALVGERVLGFEALLRWHHAEFGHVPPSEFIPLAEESGLILPVGAWVLREALRQLAAWHAEGIGPLRVSVNLSPRQFEDPGLYATVTDALAGVALPPGSLELEITESTAMGDPERAIDLMGRLRAIGVVLALDDFGTGYSNLSHLKRLPVDVLKIDQMFIRHVVQDAGDAAIVRAVIALAHGFGLTVVAEGVESQAQVIKLAQLGCDIVQGYHYGAPMLAEGVPGWLQDRGWPIGG